jgi:menaquinone-specific isochorismate synthase
MTIALAPERSIVRTFEVPDTPHLLSLLDHDGGMAWVQGTPNNQQGIVARGEVARIELAGPERFSRAQRWWSTWSAACDGDSPVAFASFAFSATPGTSVMVVPEVAIRRTLGVTTATVVGSVERVAQLRGEIPALLDSANPSFQQVHAVSYSTGSLPLADWSAAVDAAIARITRGELDKVVLARDIVAQLAGSVDVSALLNRLNAAFPDCWTFAVDGLIGATPELLVRRMGDQVTSRVLAGTVHRSPDAGRDGALAAALLGSDKDQEEHAFAVDSVAMALANHCTDLRVPTRPFVLRLANVQHLATDVTGELVDGAPVLALAASLHPTAAVCGTPSERAKAVIRELEGLDRGRYSGPVGWTDRSGDGEFGIALRCAQVEAPDRLRLFAGCGIVAGSDSAAEVAESDAKFAAMRAALSG